MLVDAEALVLVGEVRVQRVKRCCHEDLQAVAHHQHTLTVQHIRCRARLRHVRRVGAWSEGRSATVARVDVGAVGAKTARAVACQRDHRNVGTDEGVAVVTGQIIDQAEIVNRHVALVDHIELPGHRQVIRVRRRHDAHQVLGQLQHRQVSAGWIIFIRHVVVRLGWIAVVLGQRINIVRTNAVVAAIRVGARGGLIQYRAIEDTVFIGIMQTARHDFVAKGQGREVGHAGVVKDDGIGQRDAIARVQTVQRRGRARAAGDLVDAIVCVAVEADTVQPAATLTGAGRAVVDHKAGVGNIITFSRALDRQTRSIRIKCNQGRLIVGDCDVVERQLAEVLYRDVEDLRDGLRFRVHAKVGNGLGNTDGRHLQNRWIFWVFRIVRITRDVVGRIIAHLDWAVWRAVTVGVDNIRRTVAVGVHEAHGLCNVLQRQKIAKGVRSSQLRIQRNHELNRDVAAYVQHLVCIEQSDVAITVKGVVWRQGTIGREGCEYGWQFGHRHGVQNRDAGSNIHATIDGGDEGCTKLVIQIFFQIHVGQQRVARVHRDQAVGHVQPLRVRGVLRHTFDGLERCDTWDWRRIIGRVIARIVAVFGLNARVALVFHRWEAWRRVWINSRTKDVVHAHEVRLRVSIQWSNDHKADRCTHWKLRGCPACRVVIDQIDGTARVAGEANDVGRQTNARRRTRAHRGYVVFVGVRGQEDRRRLNRSIKGCTKVLFEVLFDLQLPQWNVTHVFSRNQEADFGQRAPLIVADDGLGDLQISHGHRCRIVFRITARVVWISRRITVTIRQVACIRTWVRIAIWRRDLVIQWTWIAVVFDAIPITVSIGVNLGLVGDEGTCRQRVVDVEVDDELGAHGKRDALANGKTVSTRRRRTDRDFFVGYKEARARDIKVSH